MKTLSPTKTGLAVGVFLGGWHVIWALLVALNWAQPIYDFILWAHMIHLQLTIGPFELAAATALIVVTFVRGGPRESDRWLSLARPEKDEHG